MSRSNGHRPRRGHPGPNVLVRGDTGSVTGASRDAQGGARDVKQQGPSESGDLAAREFGVPQADIPGGVRHLVNPQTHPDSPAPYEPRPADYHKEHGVPPHDWGQYETPPDESEHRAAERPAPVPQERDGVPVYMVEGPGEKRVIRALVTEGPVTIPTGTVDPLRVAVRDPRRVKFWICNEEAAGGNIPNNGQSLQATGSQTTPTAGTSIASISSGQVPAGQYQITVILNLAGTPAQGTDNSNFQLQAAGTNITLGNAIATVDQTFGPYTINSTGGQQIRVVALGNATSGAIYTATIIATPVAGPGSGVTTGGPGVRIGDWETTTDGRGLLIGAGQIKDFNSQDDVYLINLSGTSVTVSWGYETEVEVAGAEPERVT